MIKGIIYDLDDTLFDTTGILFYQALKNASNTLLENGFNSDYDTLFSFLKEKSNDIKSVADLFGTLCKEFGYSDDDTNKFIDAAKISYYSSELPSNLSPFDDVRSILTNLSKENKLGLVTFGNKTQQLKKIELLGLLDYFDYVKVSESGHLSKQYFFKDFISKFNLNSDEVICIGDRIDSEIRDANNLGMYTVQYYHGRRKDLIPMGESEVPDYVIKSNSEILKIVDILNRNHKPLKDLNVVCIGGGTGMPTVLNGLKKYTNNLTALVGVTDSGRSSGMLRRDMGILPPGDIRNCLISLSKSEKLLHDLFQYRFEAGNLEGHSFGNLLIAALSKVTGSFENAINETSKILNIQGQVLPISLEDTHLCGEFEDGAIVEEEDEIYRRHALSKSSAKLKRVFLKDEKKGNPSAIKAIKDADCIIIGPGSHYVSVLNNFLYPDIRDAINSSSAKKIYICNIVTQPFQTDDYSVSDHVKQLMEYLQGKIDYVIVNNKIPKLELMKKYEDDGSYLVKYNRESLKLLGVEAIEADVMEEILEQRILYERKDLLRHDSDKIAKSIIEHVFN